MNPPADPPPNLPPPNSARLADSPWFWAYLFGVGALIALALMLPKFNARQSQIEREYQGRTRAAQNLNQQQPNMPMSTPGSTLVTLAPLMVLVGVSTAIAWLVFWRQRTRRGRPEELRRM